MKSDALSAMVTRTKLQASGALADGVDKTTEKAGEERPKTPLTWDERERLRTLTSPSTCLAEFGRCLIMDDTGITDSVDGESRESK